MQPLKKNGASKYTVKWVKESYRTVRTAYVFFKPIPQGNSVFVYEHVACARRMEAQRTATFQFSVDFREVDFQKTER